jgi:hypothetical protein
LEESRKHNIKFIIPWIVIHELNRIKDNAVSSFDRQLSESSRSAFRFMNHNMLRNNSSLAGQRIDETFAKRSELSNIVNI